MVNGVVLISWRESILKKQIEYGARLGHVVLTLANMELENFFTNVMPVADYYDQSDMLIAVINYYYYLHLQITNIYLVKLFLEKLL